MAHTTVFRKETYQTHKSVSPTAINTSTEFKCRYKELTWNQRPPGILPPKLSIGPKLNTKKIAQRQVSKRSSEAVIQKK